MKQHIEKAKELFDLKIVYNVVIGMFLGLIIIKVVGFVAWSLGLGMHQSMYQYDRGMERGGMYMMHDGR